MLNAKQEQTFKASCLHEDNERVCVGGGGLPDHDDHPGPDAASTEEN